MTPSEVLTPVPDIATDAFCIVNPIGCAVHNTTWLELAVWLPVAVIIVIAASWAFDHLFDGVFWLAEKLFGKKGGAA